MVATFKGGCMRLYADGPKWHVDSDHHIEGIDPTIDPTIDSSGFLNFWTIEKHPIFSGTVQVDESLAGRSIRAGGPSNGTHLVRIQLMKADPAGGMDIPLDLNNPVHWSRVAGPTCNLWITLWHDVPLGG